MVAQVFLTLLITSFVFASQVDVDLVVPDADNVNEFLSVKLSKIGENGNKTGVDVTVELRIHVIDGNVHLNGNKMEHNTVNAVHIKLTIVELQNGIASDPRLAPVHLRVLVIERVNMEGRITLFVEEEFISIDNLKVEQVYVHRVGWEDMVKRPTEQVPLANSDIHQKPMENDMHKNYLGMPQYPDEHGFKYEENAMLSSFFSYHWYECHENCMHFHCNKSKHESYHHHEKNHHNHGFWHKISCWYRCLNFRSKIALYSVSFLTLIAISLCCCMCIRKRRMAKVLLLTQTPMNNSVEVKDDNKDEKKNSDESFDFHFQFDHDVVVSDKEKLIA